MPVIVKVRVIVIVTVPVRVSIIVTETLKVMAIVRVREIVNLGI